MSVNTISCHNVSYLVIIYDVTLNINRIIDSRTIKDPEKARLSRGLMRLEGFGLRRKYGYTRAYP